MLSHRRSSIKNGGRRPPTPSPRKRGEGELMPPLQRKVISLSELRHAEFTGELIQPAHQRRRDRNSVARPRRPGGMAALAGNENPLHPRHPAGVAKIAYQGIDTRLEVRDIAERSDVDGRDGLPGVGD